MTPFLWMCTSSTTALAPGHNPGAMGSLVLPPPGLHPRRPPSTALPQPVIAPAILFPFVYRKGSPTGGPGPHSILRRENRAGGWLLLRWRHTQKGGCLRQGLWRLPSFQEKLFLSAVYWKVGGSALWGSSGVAHSRGHSVYLLQLSMT